MLKLPRRRRGSAAAEFALTAPVMVLMLLGTIEYGNYFTELATVASCVRDGARYGGNQTTTALARNRARAATLQLLTDVGYPCSGPGSACTVSASLIQQNGLAMLQVDARVPYRQLTNAVPRGGAGEVVLPSVINVTTVYPFVGP
jgi:Flp pilus assembly protein TadG